MAGTVHVVPAVPFAMPVYRLSEWTGNATDEYGVDWVVEEETGWSSTGAVRSQTQDRANSDGANGRPGLFGSRVVTLSGKALCPDRRTMMEAQDRFRALQPVKALVPLVVEEEHLTRQVRVRASTGPLVRDRGSQVFEWQMTLAAPDYRRYATEPLSDEAHIGGASAWARRYPRRHDWSYDVLQGSTSAVELDLPGNEPTGAVITVTGQVDAGWTLLHEQSNRRIRSLRRSDWNEYVVLDTGRGTARVGGTADFAGDLARPQWFALQPGPNTVRLIATQDGSTPEEQRDTARLTVVAYPAWR